MVGNGEQLTSNQVCKTIQVLIQGQQFILDLYLLELSSSDVVQGVQWLKQLGHIFVDYQALTMTFVHGPSYVELKGDTDFSPNPLSYNQIC